MRNALRGWTVFAALSAAATALPALAVSSDGSNLPYAGAQYLFEFGDSQRDSDNGDGVNLNLGVPLSDMPNMALEITLTDIGRERDIDGKDDYQTALLLNLVRDFGTFGWDGEQGMRFKPFVLGGIGAVQEDVRGDKHMHAGLNLGGGVVIPTNFHGLGVRAEAGVLAHFNDGKSVADEDLLTDFRIGLGVQMPLWFLADKGGATAPAEDCGVRVVSGLPGSYRDCGPDSDRDGVADAADQCPATPAGTLVDGKGCPVTDGFVLRNVNFELDSATLTESSKTVLDSVAATLNSPANQAINVQIGGHTDVVGTEEYNVMLSQRRADAVREYMTSKGVSAERMRAQGFGTSQPVASNDSEEGRAQNRRVEFKIIVE